MRILNCLAATMSLMIILSGCQTTQEHGTNLSPEQLYEQGITQIEERDYKEAANTLSKIFFLDPGHKLTPKSEILHAYALYQQGKYDEAEDVIDIFLKLHPASKNAPYMHYLRGLCRYRQVSDVKLDQTSALQALAIFNGIAQKYPNSDYGRDAKHKAELMLDHLAGKEIYIGRYYLEKRNPIAAIKRFQTVLDNYNTTKHVPEALYRLIEANLTIGLTNEAQAYLIQLQNNHAETSWAEYGKQLME